MNPSYSIIASAPGNLMLLGEHAVLHKKLCLVCAIDQRLSITLIPRHDDLVIINSALGDYQSSLSRLIPDERFKFVLATLTAHQLLIKQGFELQITADFSDKIGFGSSAAVTVATCAALNYLLNRTTDLNYIFHLARQIIWQVQGTGSGADVAASVYGGIVAYRMQPFYVEKLAYSPSLIAVYSGSKTPTITVIDKVNNAIAANPVFFADLFNEMEKCSELGKAAIIKQDWQQLAYSFSAQQLLLDKLGVNTPDLQEIIDDLNSQPHILSAKISGAGMGDCVIALGQLAANTFPRSESHFVKGIKQIPITITEQGLIVHEQN